MSDLHHIRIVGLVSTMCRKWSGLLCGRPVGI